MTEPTHALSPTSEIYAELERAYQHFNQTLFDDRLPNCVITLQRTHDTQGFFSPAQYAHRKQAGIAHEITLNPSYFAVRSIPETLSVLVREMVSLDQHLNSQKPPRRRYRNKEWADMAEAIGLMPSDTGLPGGKRTGDGVLTYIIDGGRFDLACAELLDDDFVLTWLDRYPPFTPPAPAPVSAPNEIPTASVPSDSAALVGMDDSLEDSENESLSPFLASDAAPAGEDAIGLLAGADSELTDAVTGDDAAVPAPKKPPAPPMKVFDAPVMDNLAELGIEPKEKAKNLSKTKFTCPDCSANAWGRPSLKLLCGGVGDNEHAPVRMLQANNDQG